MGKVDFSIREEVKIMLKEKLNIEMSEKEIDEVIFEIEQYDTFLSIVGLFVAKGIKDVCEKTNKSFDIKKIEDQLKINSKGININDLE